MKINEHIRLVFGSQNVELRTLMIDLGLKPWPPKLNS
jgi:hypothetical protein